MLPHGLAELLLPGLGQLQGLSSHLPLRSAPTLLPASGEPHDNTVSVSECLKMSSRLSCLCTHTHSHVETPTGLLQLGQPPWTHRPQSLPLPSPQAPRTQQSGTGGLTVYGGLVWLKTHSHQPIRHGAWPLASRRAESPGVRGQPG